MSDLLNFAATSARHGLPLIFPGQVQKEFFVNEAHALMDALLHPVVLGTASSPPADAADGDCWIVGVEAHGEWVDQAAMLDAIRPADDGGSDGPRRRRRAASVDARAVHQIRSYRDHIQ